MEQNTKSNSEIPENAYRELKEGEVYNPVMSANKTYPEVTTWSLVLGLLMAVLFSAAAAYSGLKIGQVMEAAIPISIIAVGLSTAFKKSNPLGQNVIIQSIGSSSGVIVAGAVFTLPALYILGIDKKLGVDFFQMFMASLLGGVIGILFLIPFRKYFVKDMHGKYPFPEATAITEIVITGEKGGKQAAILVVSGLVGGLYDFAFSSLGLFKETFTSKVLPYGTELAQKLKLEFQLNISSMIFGFGYLVGLKYSLIITVGSLLSWFVFVPLINQIGAIAVGVGGINPFDALSADQIFRQFVRPIGIGAIAMAGIIGIIKSSGVIVSAFGLAVNGITGKNSGAIDESRTQKDIKITFIFFMILLTVLALFIFLMSGMNLTLTQAIIALLTIVIISFLFTTVAANAIAIVGSNPVSGMTLMTLILSSVILTQVGLTGDQGIKSSLIIGGIVCTALSVAGGLITDFKVGYWLGSTPIKQQQFKFLGVLVSAATVGGVIYILNGAYGFVKTDLHQMPMIAPQANAMAAVIEPLMSPNAHVNWGLYLVGAIISVLVNWLGISPLAFALGMFIPQPLNTPLIVGGLVNHFISKSSKDKDISESRIQRGTLIASGFMAGASLFGVLGAFLLFFGIDMSIGAHWTESYGSEVLAIFMFALLIVYFVWDSMRAKKD
jgi:putative OPT family oligopeptide transporter